MAPKKFAKGAIYGRLVQRSKVKKVSSRRFGTPVKKRKPISSAKERYNRLKSSKSCANNRNFSLWRRSAKKPAAVPTTMPFRRMGSVTMPYRNMASAVTPWRRLLQTADTVIRAPIKKKQTTKSQTGFKLQRTNSRQKIERIFNEYSKKKRAYKGRSLKHCTHANNESKKVKTNSTKSKINRSQFKMPSNFRRFVSAAKMRSSKSVNVISNIKNKCISSNSVAISISDHSTMSNKKTTRRVYVGNANSKDNASLSNDSLPVGNVDFPINAINTSDTVGAVNAVSAISCNVENATNVMNPDNAANINVTSNVNVCAAVSESNSFNTNNASNVDNAPIEITEENQVNATNPGNELTKPKD